MHAIVHKTSGTLPDIATRPSRLDPAGETVQLPHHRHMNLSGAAGWTVTVLSGFAWITQDGDVRDIVLDAGQSFTLDRDGPAIISALGNARLRVARPDSMPKQQHAAIRRLFSAQTRASYA